LLLTFATSLIFQTSVGICSNVAMRISCLPGFLYFVALFARAAKKHTDIPNICTRQNIGVDRY
jgi:hypothetical protein